MTQGGLPEALVRALLWVGMARHTVDERGFAAITRLRDAHEANRRMSLADVQGVGPRPVPDADDRRGGSARRHPRAAAEAIEDRRDAFAILRGIIEASGAPGDAPAARLQRVSALFGLGPELVTLAPSAGRKAS